MKYIDTIKTKYNFAYVTPIPQNNFEADLLCTKIKSLLKIDVAYLHESHCVCPVFHKIYSKNEFDENGWIKGEIIINTLQQYPSVNDFPKNLEIVYKGFYPLKKGVTLKAQYRLICLDTYLAGRKGIGFTIDPSYQIQWKITQKNHWIDSLTGIGNIGDLVFEKCSN